MCSLVCVYVIVCVCLEGGSWWEKGCRRCRAGDARGCCAGQWVPGGVVQGRGFPDGCALLKLNKMEIEGSPLCAEVVSSPLSFLHSQLL